MKIQFSTAEAMFYSDFLLEGPTRWLSNMRVRPCPLLGVLVVFKESREKIIEKLKRLRTTYEYFTVDGMIAAEMGFGGGTPSEAAIQGALNRCKKCIERKGKWVRVDPDSGRMEFRRPRKQEIHDDTTTHKSRQKEKNAEIGEATAQSSNIGAAAQAEDVTPEKAAAPVAAQAVTAPAKGVEQSASQSAESPAQRAAAGDKGGKAQGKGGKAQGKNGQNGKATKSGRANPKPKASAKGKAKTCKQSKPATPQTVAKKASDISIAYTQTINRAKKRKADIDGDIDGYGWAGTERFGGKLDRLLVKAEAALDEFPELKALVTLGEHLPDYVKDAVTESMRKIDSLQCAIDNLDQQTKRLKTLHEQDSSQPSQ